MHYGKSKYFTHNYNYYGRNLKSSEALLQKYKSKGGYNFNKIHQWIIECNGEQPH